MNCRKDTSYLSRSRPCQLRRATDVQRDHESFRVDELQRCLAGREARSNTHMLYLQAHEFALGAYPGRRHTTRALLVRFRPPFLASTMRGVRGVVRCGRG